MNSPTPIFIPHCSFSWNQIFHFPQLWHYYYCIYNYTARLLKGIIRSYLHPMLWNTIFYNSYWIQSAPIDNQLLYSASMWTMSSFFFLNAACKTHYNIVLHIIYLFTSCENKNDECLFSMLHWSDTVHCTVCGGDKSLWTCSLE